MMDVTHTTSAPAGTPLADTLHGHVAAMAQRQPQAPAVQSAESTWCWREFAQRIETTAAALQAAGAQGGERLVVVSENSPATLVAVLAAQSLRLWPAVINARLPWAEVAQQISCVEPRLVLFATAGSEATARHAAQSDAQPLVAADLDGLCWLARQPLIGSQSVAARPGDETGLMVFTSGTTGLPKAVMFSHAGLLHHGLAVGTGRGTRADDTVEVVAPLSHVMGVAGVLAALLFGAAIRIRPRLAPSELVDAIRQGDITQASMVPVAWTRLLEQIERQQIDITGHRLRVLVSGGAPLDPELKLRIEQVFGRPIQNAYGMTEVAPLARTPAGRLAQPWSVGQPELGVQVRIVSEQGALVAPGEVGEIQAHGPSVMLGYFGNPQATAEVMRPGGWFATGDLGRWLPDGDLAVVGRRKEMIIRSGFNVYPAEVEAALGGHAAVLHAAVLGEPAALGDESVVAYVQLREGHAASPQLRDAIEAHVRGCIAAYKCPSAIHFVAQMPLGSTGKILKRALAGQR